MSDLRALNVTWRGWLGIGAMLIFGLVLIGSTGGCGVVECGKGTVEIDGVCVAGKALQCGVGFKASGAECVPSDAWPAIVCGKNAEFDKASGTCIGTGGTVEPDACQGKCPAPTSSGISLCGQVFDGISLLSKWAGKGKATPVTGSHGARVKIYDPIKFVTSPTTAPEKVGKLDDKGCFYISDVTIPFSGFVALAIDDDTDAGTKWAFVATGETPTPDKNSINLEIPALTEKQIASWGNDIVKVGSMVMVYLDGNGKAVEGVTPRLDVKDWPSWEKHPLTNKDYELFFFSDDGSKFNKGSTSVTTTSQAGAVVVKQAQVESHSGTKKGCTIEAGLGGSAAGTLFFRIFDVTGC